MLQQRWIASRRTQVSVRQEDSQLMCEGSSRTTKGLTDDGSTTNSKEVREVMLLGKVDSISPAVAMQQKKQVARGGIGSVAARWSITAETHDSWLGSTRVLS